MRILSLAVIGALSVVMMISCAQTADPKDTAIKTVLSLGQPARLAPRPKAKVLVVTNQALPNGHGEIDRDQEPQLRPEQLTIAEKRQSIDGETIPLAGGFAESIPPAIKNIRQAPAPRRAQLTTIPALPARDDATADEPTRRRRRVSAEHDRFVIAGATPAAVTPDVLPTVKPVSKLKPFTIKLDQSSPLPLPKQVSGANIAMLPTSSPTVSHNLGNQDGNRAAAAPSVQTVAHQEPATQNATPDAQVTDLVVGTLRPSSRRVAQVVAQVTTPADTQHDSNVDAGTNDSKPLPMANPIAIPLESVPNTDRASIEKQGDLVTLVATDADVRDILRMIAEYHKLNLVIGPEVNGLVTVSIRGARLDEVLDAIVGVAGFQWHRSGNLLYITSSESEILLDPKVQGRRLQVYPLNYVAATDLEPIVNRLLSPIGKVFTSEADAVDQLKTRELLIVEDIEASHERVAQYIAQIDIPPRQVLVEAHVLQIDLNDEERCGVNLRGIARLSGAKITLQGTGFAEEEPDGPSMAFRIAASDVEHLVEAIHVNTNARTLASPKVSVVNRQTAKVQIGQRLPYAVSTTTQTATIQNVQFLDVGIVLEVTPVITQDGNILMTVLPKVSGGRITESGFPEEDTTQVSTTVLMPDGSGLVIGGLIRETDSETNAVVPKLGKIPVIKHLFNKRTAENRRNELVVALVTHIMDGGANPVRQKECIDLQNALPEHAASELHVTPEIRYTPR